MSERFVPFSARANDASHDAFLALLEGVPRHLDEPLRGWLRAQFPDIERDLQGVLYRVGIDLHWEIPGGRDAWKRGQALQFALSGGQMLDLADYFLNDMEKKDDVRARWLEGILARAGSAYSVEFVETPSPHHQLVTRIEPAMSEIFAKASAPTDNASTHLQRAWLAAFGRNAEPSLAYQEAVSALEASYDAIVLPANPRATLGTIVQAIRDKPEKWETRLNADMPRHSGVLLVADQLDAVWKTQRRHGSSHTGAATSCSIEEAQDAVISAAALVQLVRQRGFIAK